MIGESGWDRTIDTLIKRQGLAQAAQGVLLLWSAFGAYGIQ
jgi:hypothetical protein